MISKIFNKLKYQWKLYILRDRFTVAYKQWIKDKGDLILRYNYPLNEDSIVFDLGGYHGEFSEKIFQMYGCHIYIFEPVKEFNKIINEKFYGNSKIHVYDFGLSNDEKWLDINISNDASSIFQIKGEKERIKLKSINAFIEENNIKHIDLFKINIEGGEFEVIPALIQSNNINIIDNLQIQFHTFIDSAEEKRNKIRKDLSNTHTEVYNYYFIWENWTKHAETD